MTNDQASMTDGKEGDPPSLVFLRSSFAALRGEHVLHFEDALDQTIDVFGLVVEVKTGTGTGGDP